MSLTAVKTHFGGLCSVALRPRPASLSFGGSLDLKAGASPPRGGGRGPPMTHFYRLTFPLCAEPPLQPCVAAHPWLRPRLPGPSETSACAPLRLGASGDPPSRMLQSAPHGLPDTPPIPPDFLAGPGPSNGRPPTPAAAETRPEASFPVEGCGEPWGESSRSQPLPSSLSDRRPDSHSVVPSRAPFDAAPNSLLIGDAARTPLPPASHTQSFRPKPAQDALTCSSLEPQPPSASEGSSLFPYRDGTALCTLPILMQIISFIDKTQNSVGTKLLP